MSVSPHHKARTRSQVSGPLVTVLSISLPCSLPRKPSTSLLPSDNPYAPTFFHRKPRDVPSSLSGFSLSTPSQIFCQTGHSHPTLPTSFLQTCPTSSLSPASSKVLPGASPSCQEQGTGAGTYHCRREGGCFPQGARLGLRGPGTQLCPVQLLEHQQGCAKSKEERNTSTQGWGKG